MNNKYWPWEQKFTKKTAATVVVICGVKILQSKAGCDMDEE